eukprot:TRINITY_DN2223_c0_g1_i2.p3 TRINITY_DN2223_c0_g1~~TRINITY_DN2223_c0_g1_i2.p3  ORF type:complete len:187 (+),score=54.03 TRINITY_DN2223_c0_g1_i2:928-1488(+)
MVNDGKNIHIRNLLAQINTHSRKVEDRHVVLFDDNATNIQMAREAGYVAVHCPNGFNRHVWALWMNSFGKHRPDFFSVDLLTGLPPEQGHKIRRSASDPQGFHRRDRSPYVLPGPGYATYAGGEPTSPVYIREDGVPVVAVPASPAHSTRSVVPTAASYIMPAYVNSPYVNAAYPTSPTAMWQYPA